MAKRIPKKERTAVRTGDVRDMWKVLQGKRDELRAALYKTLVNGCTPDGRLTVIQRKPDMWICLYEKYEVGFVCEENGAVWVKILRYCRKSRRDEILGRAA